MDVSQSILEVIRGRVVEATHTGSIVVVDSTGKLLHSYGDSHTVAFLRSSAKPFQVLPFVEHGGVEHFNFTQNELAISCASHETAQLHLDTVKTMRAKIGIQEENMQCGDASRMNNELESSTRVRPAITLEILHQLKALNEAQLKSLAKFWPKKQIKNHGDLVTGESHPVFQLA